MLSTVLGVGALGVAAFEVLRVQRNPIKGTLEQSLYEAGLFHEHRRQDGKKTVQRCRITACYREKFGYDTTLRLPVGLTISKLREKLEVLEMALNAEIVVESEGQYARLKVGQLPLNERMNYHDGLIYAGHGLHIPLYSRFGVETIDFDSEIGAHVLIAGASGMGKSKLLDLILTLIILQTNGKSVISLINNKLIDTFNYRDIPSVSIHESLFEAEAALDNVISELESRKQKMANVGAVKTSDYTLEYLPPLFVIIDEYARFSDSDSFQSKVIEIAESGRSFDIHLVIATQRPDASEVLNPRIKANCMTKIALKTTTASNSRVILESDDAYRLPEIQGRAILQKSGNKTVQVPFLSAEQQAILLQPYYQRVGDKKHDATRSEIVELPDEISSPKPRSRRKASSKRVRQPVSNGDANLQAP